MHTKMGLEVRSLIVCLPTTRDMADVLPFGNTNTMGLGSFNTVRTLTSMTATGINSSLGFK